MPAALLTSRGGDYRPGSPFAPFNQQEPCLKVILGFLGITDFCVAAFEGTDSHGAEERLALAVEKARALAHSF